MMHTGMISMNKVCSLLRVMGLYIIYKCSNYGVVIMMMSNDDEDKDEEDDNCHL